MWWAIICTRQSRLSFDAEDLQKVLRLKERRCGDVGWQLARGLLVKEGPPLIVCKHQVSQGVRVPVQRVLRSSLDRVKLHVHESLDTLDLVRAHSRYREFARLHLCAL